MPGRAAPAEASSGLAAGLSQLAGSNAYLKAVQVSRGGAAWAMGTNIPPSSAASGLIERWNGRSWRQVAGPSLTPGAASSLSGIAETSAANAWAVGSITFDGVTTQTLVEHWDGSGWTLVPSPSPGGPLTPSSLAAVSALSPANAWAVGDYFTCGACEPMYMQTLIEHWDGTAWTQVPSQSPGPADSFLLAVSAVSRSSAWAVGAYTGTGGLLQTLIEHWNGTTWTRIRSPSPGGPKRTNILFGVAALSPSNAWAAGTYVGAGGDHTLVEHWNGTVWKLVRSPNGPIGSVGSFLYAVTATSSSSAWAAGTYVRHGTDQTLIEHWNGKTWKQVASPNPGGSTLPNFLSAIAASGPASAWAAGYYVKNRGGPGLTLTEHWNGKAWKWVPSLNP